MIDPSDITQFNRTDDELLEFWLFCLMVAGKNARTQARTLQRFIDFLPKGPTLLARLAEIIDEEDLRETLVAARTGQYNRLEHAINCSVILLSENRRWFRDARISNLEMIPGVGPKTARFFVLHSRPDQRIAVLDVHVLKLLRENGVEKVPKATPGSTRQYERLETAFLDLADHSGMTVAEFDLQTWNRYSRA